MDYLSAFQWHIGITLNYIRGSSTPTSVKVPLANPDGYDYSRKKDRMWRKNRRRNQDSDCEGVDLNRNFGKAFGTASSNNPCHEDFRGTSAFSEPESAAIRIRSGIFDNRNRSKL